jgi:hypothetical protein
MALAGIKLKVHVTHSTIIAAMAAATQKSVFPIFMCDATFGVQEFAQ